MKKALIALLSAVLIQLACNTVTGTSDGPASSNAPANTEAQDSAEKPIPNTPASFNPHDWGEFELLHEYWPEVNAELGGSIEAASLAVTGVDYNSLSGYIAVAGCDQAMIDADDLMALPFPGCRDTVSGKSANAFLFILDARSGETVASLPPTGTQDTVQGLQFSHDGKLLAYGLASGHIVLWDLNAGNIESDIPQPPPESEWWPHESAFSPDDRLVAVNYGTSTKIWDRNTQSFIAEIEEPKWPLPTFSQDGKTLLLIGPPVDTIRTDTWERLSRIWDDTIVDGYYFFPDWATFNISPDLTLWAQAEIVLDETVENKNGPVLVYDVKTEEVLQTLEGTWNAPGSMAFTPDGRYLLRLDDTGLGLAVWQVDGWIFSDESSVLADKITSEDHFIRDLRFSSDGRSILIWTYARLAMYGLP